MRRDQSAIQSRANGEFCKEHCQLISVQGNMKNPPRDGIPWRVKSKRLGSSRGEPLAWRESGNRVLGSLSSSKKGWHIASIAERRCVGVYSRSAEIKSMASWGARRKTWEDSFSAFFRCRRLGACTLLKGCGLI